MINIIIITEKKQNVIKSSYIQNINVIEKLYNEKISMENRIKLLEDILQRNKNTKDHHGVYVRSIVDEVYNNNIILLSGLDSHEHHELRVFLKP